MADQPQVMMSKAEQEANAEKLRAEAVRAVAEAERLRAETAEREANTRRYVAQAIEAELKAQKAEEDEAARHATDDWHHVYRFDGEVSAASVSKCLSKLTEWHRLHPNCDIEVIFSSPGGSIWDGMELYDSLRELSRQGHKIITGGLGMAASMAGILLMAGDHRWIGRESWLLIHRAAFLAMGSTYEVEDRVELIKRIEKRIIDIFVDRSGGKMTAQKIRRNWDRKDFWLSSDECLEFGLVDAVR